MSFTIWILDCILARRTQREVFFFFFFLTYAKNHLSYKRIDMASEGSLISYVGACMHPRRGINVPSIVNVE